MRWIALLCVLASSTSVAGKPQTDFKDGDLILHTSTSSQSAAIRLATHSVYSHVGLIEVAEDGVFVIEAVQPVKRTPIGRFQARGLQQRWTVLRDPTLTAEQRASIVAEARRHLGKPYDFKFGWDDESLYCSELVRKAFARGAGKSIGRMQRLAELDLKLVKPALEGRYGKGAVPMTLELITPAALAEDATLEVVKTTFPEKLVARRSRT